jgi:outer membrane protein
VTKRDRAGSDAWVRFYAVPSSSTRLARLLFGLVLLPALAHADGVVEPLLLPPPKDRDWVVVLGMIASTGPEYPGAQRQGSGLTPGFFLRYKRLTVTNRSGFAPRTTDNAVRGLGLDLNTSGRFRANLGLRFDGGRKESSNVAYAGLGNIEPTVRARVGGSWLLDDGWRIAASWNMDAFGRGGGNYGDLGFAHELTVSPHTNWSWGASVSAANERYLRTYYGITPEQSARSGYAEYAPHAGLREVGAFVNLRSDLSSRWVLIAGAGVTRLMGPAAASPLVLKRNGWGANVGLAWRF